MRDIIKKQYKYIGCFLLFVIGININIDICINVYGQVIYILSIRFKQINNDHSIINSPIALHQDQQQFMTMTHQQPPCNQFRPIANQQNQQPPPPPKKYSRPCFTLKQLILILVPSLIFCSIAAYYGLNSEYYTYTNPFSTPGFFYNCEQQESIFHYIHESPYLQSLKGYFKSKYELFLPSCLHIKRQHLKRWNTQRTVIQWGKHNIVAAETILYYSDDEINYLQLVVLSLLTGHLGKVYTTIKADQECLPDIRSLYNQINNIRYEKNKDISIRKYSTIISKTQNTTISLISKIQSNVQYQNMLLFMTSKMLEDNKYQFTKVIQNSQVSLFCIQVSNQDCNSLPLTKKIYNISDLKNCLSNTNYFQIRSREKEEESKNQDLISKIQQAENQYKLSTHKIVNKKPIIENLQININVFTQEKQIKIKQWESQLAIVQWVINKTKHTYNIFYSYNYNYANILVILNVASILNQGNLIINCSKTDKQIIQKYSNRFQFKNINFRNYTDLQFKQELIITDDFSFIKKIAEKTKIPNEGILAYFGESNETIQNSMFELYSKFNLKKIDIYSAQNRQTIFNNPIFHLKKPHGFFSLENSKNVMYYYWAGSIQELLYKQNLYENLRLIINANKPEIKVVWPQVLSYFEQAKAPFHKGFYHLSQIHRADYIHAYLMNYYGGGYFDIKNIQFDWEQFFDELQSSPINIYGIGYIDSETKNCDGHESFYLCKNLQKRQNLIIGYKHHILKKQTIFTQNWMNKMNTILDENLDRLSLMPSWFGNVEECGQIKKTAYYPFKQLQLGSLIFQGAQRQKEGHFYTNFPTPITVE